MIRIAFVLAAFTGMLCPLQAAFTITGNPAADLGWAANSNSLQNTNYVRGTANFAFDTYSFEMRIPTGMNALTATGWNAGDRVVGLGGVFTAPMTPTDLGYAPGTVFTGPAQNSLLNTNSRFIAKFGTNTASNIFSPSTVPPNAGNGAGSHSSGNGGIGSVHVSIASNRLSLANAGMLITPDLSPNGSGGFDNVAQYVTVGATGANGIDLLVGSAFPSARYIYNLDGSGLLTSWEVLLNTTMVGQYPNPNIIVGQPTGGGNWILSVQAGSGAAPFTDGLLVTDPFFEAPAPPAFFALLFGGAGVLAVRRRRG